MYKAERMQESRYLATTVLEGFQDKKALDITILDLRSFNNAIADFFIICSGNSDTHVEALMKSVDEVVYKKLGQEPWKVEGIGNREWVLLDYVDVVAHIFQKGKRHFYGLEDLWADAVVDKL